MNCRFCHGRGCIACAGEQERERKAAERGHEHDLAMYRRLAAGTTTESDRLQIAAITAISDRLPIEQRGLFTMAEANVLVAERVVAGDDAQTVRDRLTPYLKYEAPLLSVPNTPEGWAFLKPLLRREVLEQALGPGGGGMAEVIANAEAALEEHPEYRGFGQGKSKDEV
jgi:hypothetical protein